MTPRAHNEEDMDVPQICDLVVVLPGIMGSTLARHGTLVWAPSAGAVLTAILTFGRSVRELTLPKGTGDDRPSDGVEPVEVMPDLQVLPGVWSANIGYGRLLDWSSGPNHIEEAWNISRRSISRCL